MSKKSKSYRGQRRYKNSCKNGCGCFFCTGYSKHDRQEIIDKIIKKQIKDENY